MNNSRPFFVLLVFVMLITLFVGGMVGNTDLTPNTPSRLAGAAVTAGPNQINRAMGASIQGSICGQAYTVRRGDTLSRIAQICGISLESLLAANPAISNPHLIRENQLIAMPLVVLTATPTAEPLQDPSALASSTGGLRPGAPIKLMMKNFLPETLYQVGMGPVRSTVTPYGEARTDASGMLTTTINIPSAAKTGEEWVIAIYQENQPEVKATTQPFVIE